MALTPWRLGSCRLHFVPAPGEAESQRRGMTAISLADGDSGAASRSGFSPGWSPNLASPLRATATPAEPSLPAGKLARPRWATAGGAPRPPLNAGTGARQAGG